MQQILTAMPPWAPLAVAAVALTGALAALLYARHTIALACDRLERAQNFEHRLLKVLGKHPQVFGYGEGPEIDRPSKAQQLQEPLDEPSDTQSWPDRPTTPKAQAAEPWKVQALSLVANGRFEEAETICRKEVEADPRNAQAHNTLGVVYRKTQRLEAAVAACRQATMLEPTCASAHINLGVALRYMGQPQQAEAAYRRAIELDPSHAVAHSSLGVALNKQGRNEEAEACYLKALEIDSEYTPAWLNLAIALQKRGALEEAQAAYRCALELGSAATGRVPDESGEAAVA